MRVIVASDTEEGGGIETSLSSNMFQVDQTLRTNRTQKSYDCVFSVETCMCVEAPQPHSATLFFFFLLLYFNLSFTFSWSLMVSKTFACPTFGIYPVFCTWHVL